MIFFCAERLHDFFVRRGCVIFIVQGGCAIFIVQGDCVIFFCAERLLFFLRREVNDLFFAERFYDFCLCREVAGFFCA